MVPHLRTRLLQLFLRNNGKKKFRSGQQDYFDLGSHEVVAMMSTRAAGVCRLGCCWRNPFLDDSHTLAQAESHSCLWIFLIRPQFLTSWASLWSCFSVLMIWGLTFAKESCLRDRENENVMWCDVIWCMWGCSSPRDDSRAGKVLLAVHSKCWIPEGNFLVQFSI